MPLTTYHTGDSARGALELPADMPVSTYHISAPRAYTINGKAEDPRTLGYLTACEAR